MLRARTHHHIEQLMRTTTTSSTNRPSIIAVDCGNSRVKVSDGHVMMSVDATKAGSAALKSFFANRENHIVAWSSVSPETWNHVRTLCSAHPHIDVNAHATTHSPLRAVKAQGAGTDRILGCAGALFRMANGKGRTAGACITIDCGTATTVNVVNGRCEFIGGMIFPGLRLMAETLHRHTAQLPLVAFHEPLHRMDTAPGDDTLGAIRAGVVHATTGGIMSAVRAAHKQLRSTEVPVFITGGNAELVLPILKHEWRFVHVPDLVLDAVHRIGEAVSGAEER